MDSILTSVKKLLGIAEEYEHFDTDIIMHINTVFSILTQLGVGPATGFRIEDNTMTWGEYIPGRLDLESVKSYMYLRVKLLFDPPASSAAIDSINRMLSEIEWRLNAAVDYTQSE